MLQSFWRCLLAARTLSSIHRAAARCTAQPNSIDLVMFLLDTNVVFEMRKITLGRANVEVGL